MSFRKTLNVVAGIAVTLLANSSVLAQSVPAESETPLRMMKALEVVAGRWEMTMEVADEAGENWQQLPPEIVDISFRQKGLMLAEIPADLSSPAFHMETYITYDQYREEYRKIAVDDVWGIMDIYDGHLEGDSIVFTNLRSGTTFPVATGVWRNFRLTLKLASPRRTFLVEKSDDGGASWQPAFRATYVLMQG